MRACVRRFLPRCLLCLGLLAAPAAHAQEAAIHPHWLADGRMWYALATGPSAMDWVLVEADGGLRRFATRQLLQEAVGPGSPIDTALRPRSAPEAVPESGREVRLTIRNHTAGPVALAWLRHDGALVPYASIEAGKSATQHTFVGHRWKLTDARGGLFGYVTAPETDAAVEVDGTPAAPPQPQQGAPSPDGRWIAFVRDHDVWLRPATGTEAPQRLSRDGTARDSYRGSGLFWSPDSGKLVAFRIAAAPAHPLELVSNALDADGRPRRIAFNYLRPGDAIDHPRPVLFDLVRHSAVTLPDKLFPAPYGLYALSGMSQANGVSWAADSSRFFFAYNERGHRLMRVLAVDAAHARPSVLFEDRSKTFIDYSSKYLGYYRAKHDEIVWASERDGWNHLYVHDGHSGAVKRRLSAGPWLVQRVENVDETAGTLIARVAGRMPGQDPYHEHFVRIGLADGAVTPLTQADGMHELAFAPDGKRYLDRYSRVDLPPVTELRRAADGQLLATLEQGNPAALRGAGWQAPERFVAKGRDGRADIWGIVVRPPDFDPAKRYPLVERIYAGPHGYAVPKRFGAPAPDVAALAARGFIVVQIDGMGTNWRGKAFQDVAYKNLRDAGFPDRIAWIRALEAAYPGSIDLARVGIYGTSAGGQNAAAALLWHHDFYRAAVADSGCHDNRLDKLWWNEQWLGYPVDPSYAANSNIEHAGRMQGALLLVDGDLDTNVDPLATRRLYGALKAAGKQVELLELPGAGHGNVERGAGLARLLAFFSDQLGAPRGRAGRSAALPHP